MRICDICGKKPLTGNSIARRGLPKKKGGIGLKTTGVTRRRFFPNLQKMRVRLPSGSIQTLKVCTACLQSGNVTKAVRYRPIPAV